MKRLALLIALLLPCTVQAQTLTEPYDVTLRVGNPTGDLNVTEFDDNHKALKNFFTQTEGDYEFWVPGGAADPSTCDGPGDGDGGIQLWWNSTADELKYCSATDTWVSIIGAASGDITAVWACTSGNCDDLTAASGDTLDAGSADSTAPNKVGTSPPGTCTVGDTFFDTDATAGQNFFGCTATDTWTLQGGAGSGTITAVWTDSAGDVSDLTAGAGDTLDATGADSTAACKSGTTAPATCAIGDCFFDTDATAGQNQYGCTAVDTWTLQGDGGGGGTPGGSDTQYQYNNSATFGGAVAFTYNDATGQSTYSDDTEPPFTIEYDAGAGTSGEYQTLRLRSTTTGDQSTDIGPCVEFAFTDDTSTDQDLAMICGQTEGINETRGQLNFWVWDNSVWREAFWVDNNGDVNALVDLRTSNTSSALEFAGDLKSVGSNDFYFDGTTNTFGFNITPDTLNVDWSMQGTSANNGALMRLYSPNGETRFILNGDDATDALLQMSDDTGSAAITLRAASDATSEFAGPIEYIPTDTPPSCTATEEGSLYFDDSDQRYKKCDDTLAWVNLEGGAFTPSTIDSDYGAETVTSNWDFTGTNSAATGAWTISSLFNFDGGTEGTLRLPSSGTRPATCTVGDTYNDSDETAGENFYICTATNTWTLQGGGGGGTPGGADTQMQYNNNSAFGGISEFVFDDAATGALTFTADNASQLPLTLEAYSGATSAGVREALRIQAETTAASLSDTYGVKLVFAAYDSGGGAFQGGIATRRIGNDTTSEMLFSTYATGVEFSGMMLDSVGNLSAWQIGVGSYLKANAACLDVVADRIFHDTDCDGTKDGGEEYIDQTGGTPNEVRSIPWAASGMSGDGTECSDPSEVTINSGPKGYTLACPMASSETDGFVYGQGVPLPDGFDKTADVTFELSAYLTSDNGAGTWHGVIQIMCRSEGETINSTWSTGVGLDLTPVVGDVVYDQVQDTSGAVDTDATGEDCDAGDMFYWRWKSCDTDATPSTGCTSSAGFENDMSINAMKMEYTTSGGD